MTATPEAGGVVRSITSRPILLSDSGLLVHGERRVKLCRTDCAVVGLLLDRHPGAVPRRELTTAVWPGGSPSDDARRRILMRVRRQLAVVDLALRDRSGVGLTLERSMTAATPASS
jgi:DNA-binding winged helix-turn-helix (wHTH) protein